MTSIDERVVKMTLDNNKFEEAIKTTIKSLSSLKENLKFDKASGDFSKIEKASTKVTLKDMGNNIENISNRFSTMGIVGMTALSNITTSAMNAGKKIYDATVGQIISGGKKRALNLEQARFQIEGLKGDWDKILEDVNYGVLDTAYGLDVAAKAASQLMASNVQVGDEMKAALRGISGVAAMTNSEYEDISRIFTTVAGNGKLMTEQLNQMSSRGLNAAATLAKALHVTEGEVREMVSKGKIDFKTFAQIMDDEFGEHATKANETFTGSLSNMKAALSRIGAEVATPAYANLRDIINKITPVLKSVKTTLTPIYKVINGAMESGTKFITGFLDPLTKVGDKNTGENNLLTNILTKPMEQIANLMTRFGDIAGKLVAPIVTIFKEIGDAFKYAFGESNIFDYINRALDLIGKFADKLQISEEMATNIRKAFYLIFDVIRITINIIFKLVEVIGGTLGSVIMDVFGFMLEMFLSLLGHIKDVYVVAKEFVYQLLQLESVRTVIETIKHIFEGIRTIVSSVYNAIKDLIRVFTNKAFKTSKGVFETIANVLLKVAQAIDAIIWKIADMVESFMNLPIVQEAIEKLTNIFNTLRTAIGDIKPIVNSIASSLRSHLASAFNVSRSGISKFIATIKDLIDKYVELPTFQEVVSTLQENLTTLFDNSKTVFEKVTEVVGNLVEKFKLLSSSGFTAAIDNFERLRQKLSDIVNLGGRIETIKSIFLEAKNGLSAFVEGIVVNAGQGQETLKKFIGWIQEKVGSINLGQVIATGLGASLMKFFWNFSTLIETGTKVGNSLSMFLDNWGALGKNIGKVFKSISQNIDAKTKAIKLNAFKELIQSIVLLAGALALLSTMDQGKLRESAITLGVLAVALMGISTLMTNMQANVNPVVIAEVATSTISIAASIGILVLALKVLSTINMEGIAQRLAVMGVLMAELGILIFALSKMNKTGDIEKSMIPVVSMAVSLLLLAKALNMLNGVNGESIAIAVGLIGTLIIAMKAMAKASGEALLSSGAVIAVALALVIMIKALEKLANIPTSKLTKGIENLIPVMGMLVLLFLSTRAAGQYAVQAGASLLLISAALIVITVAIDRLASIDQSAVKRAGDVVVKILAVFAAITLMTKFAGQNASKAGRSILFMSAALILVAGAMSILAQIEPDALERATNAITSILGMFALIVAATNLAKDAKSTITMICVSLGVLIVGLAVLSLLEPKNLLTATICLNSLMLCFSMIVAASGMVKKSSVVIVLMTAVVAGLAIILKQLSESVDGSNALKAATALSEVLIAMSVAMAIVTKLGGSIGAAAQGAVALGAFIAILTGIIGALTAVCGLINDASGGAFLDVLNSGIPVLEAVGTALGSFVGGIVGGVLGSSSKALGQIGQSLSDFMTNMQGFLNGARSIDSETIQGVEALGKLLLTIAGSSFVGSLFGDVRTFLGDVGSGLKDLGSGMSEFTSALQNVDMETLRTGAEAGSLLADMCANLAEGGYAGLIFGSKSEGMKQFAENLPAFGEALVGYSDAITAGNKIDSAAVKRSATAGKAVIEMLNEISGESKGDIPSLSEAIFGSQAEGIKKFSENMVAFGVALMDYQDAISSMDSSDKIKSSAEAGTAVIKMLNEIHKEMPNENFVDLSTAVFGSQAAGIQKFGTNMIAFGRALSSYQRSIKDVKVEPIKASAEAAKAIIDVLQTLNPEGGLQGWIFGSDALADSAFASNIKSLGESLKSFSKSVSGMPTDGIDLAIEIAQSIASIYGYLSDIVTEDNFWSIFAESTSDVGKGFNSNITGLGLALNMFAQSVSGISENAASVKLASKTALALAEVYSTLKPTLEAGFGMLTIGNGGSFESLAENAAALGDGIGGFAEAVAGIDASGCTAAITIAKGLAEVFNALDPSGGVMQFWFGSQEESFTSLATNLMSLANALTNFVTQINEIGSSDLQNAVGIVEAFKDMSIQGDSQAIMNIGVAIEQFGTSINTFGNAVTDFDPGKFDEIATAIINLKDKVKDLEEFDTTKLTAITQALGDFAKAGAEAIKNGITDQDKVNEITTSAVGLITDIAVKMEEEVDKQQSTFENAGKKMLEAIGTGIENAGVDLCMPAIASLMGAVLTTLDEYKDQMTTAGNTIAQNLANGIKQRNIIVNDAMKYILDQVLKVFPKYDQKFITMGKTLMQKLASGIRSGKFSVTSAVESVLTAAASSTSVYNKFVTIGRQCAQGLANGLNDSRSRTTVMVAAISLANIAVQSAKKAAGVESPSRKFIETGKYCVQGFAIGLSDTAGLVEKASDKLGNGVVEASRNALSIMSDLLSDDIDLDPTITPHFDLREVKTATSEIETNLKSLNAVGIRAQYTGADFSGVRNGQVQTIIKETTNQYILESLNAKMVSNENLGQEIWNVLMKYYNLSQI